MKTKVEWVFFDVGSTLIDESQAYNHRIRDAIEGTDITFDMFQEKRTFFAKQNLKSDHAAIKFFGLKLTPWHKEDEVPYSDSEFILKYLYNKGYKIGVIANQSPGTTDRLKKWRLLKYISVVAASAELGVSKPNPEIFEKAFELAGCTTEKAIMIGDRLDNDIYPAKRLGMKTVWIRQGDATYQNPTHSDYEADYIIHTLSELKEIL